MSSCRRSIANQRRSHRRACGAAPVEVPLTDGQFDALVSFTFNLGSGALQRSTLSSPIVSRQALAVHVAFTINGADVLDILYGLMIKHGKPEYIRSDNGPEFSSKLFRKWLERLSVKLIQIHPGSPWENGYNERFNGTLRNEVLNCRWFNTTKQAQITINQWIKQYNHIRPHQALNMTPPIPETTNLKMVHNYGA